MTGFRLPLDIPRKRGRLAVHPTLPIAAFHQDGERAILATARGGGEVTTKKIGSASTVNLVAHPRGLGAQSRAAVSFVGPEGRALATIKTKHSFHSGYGERGIWGYEGGRGKPLGVSLIDEDFGVLNFGPLSKELRPVGVYSLDDVGVLVAEKSSIKTVFICRRDGTIDDLGPGDFAENCVALGVDGERNYVDSRGRSVAGAEPSLVMNGEGVLSLFGGEVKDAPALVLRGIRRDQGNQEAFSRRHALDDPGPLLAWDLRGARVGWATPAGIQVRPLRDLFGELYA